VAIETKAPYFIDFYILGLGVFFYFHSKTPILGGLLAFIYLGALFGEGTANINYFGLTSAILGGMFFSIYGEKIYKKSGSKLKLLMSSLLAFITTMLILNVSDLLIQEKLGLFHIEFWIFIIGFVASTSYLFFIVNKQVFTRPLGTES
jgi:hypothetical protein